MEFLCKAVAVVEELDLEAWLRAQCAEYAYDLGGVCTRLRLTLFHAGQLNAPKRAATKPSVSVSGWADAPQPFADSARRYLTQVELSLRPNTVKHIDQALREFGTWLGQVWTRQRTGCDLSFVVAHTDSKTGFCRGS